MRVEKIKVLNGDSLQPATSNVTDPVSNLWVADTIVKPFTLLRNCYDVVTIRAQAASACNVHVDEIEDVFPCTPLQESLWAQSSRRAGNRIAQYAMPLQDSIDMFRFQTAWEEVLQKTPTLRTRIFDLPGEGLVQVVISQHAQWHKYSTVDKFQDDNTQLLRGISQPLVRYAIIDTSLGEQQHLFVWIIHHALCDSWSMRCVLDRLELAYKRKKALQLTPPFQRFVKHILQIDDKRANQFWQTQFEGIEAQVFPILPSPAYQPVVCSLFTHHVIDLQWPQTDITASTVLRSAWTLLMARYTNLNDIIFGEMINGRQAAVHGIDKMVGLTVATIPMRVVFDWEQNLDQLLHQVQHQICDMAAFEQKSLEWIRQVSTEAKQACAFQTLLIIHYPGDSRHDKTQLFAMKSKDTEEEGIASTEFATHAITFECDLEERGVYMRFNFDHNIVNKPQVRRLATQVEHVLRQLCDPERKHHPVGSIETASNEDLRIMWSWNERVPETIEARVHDLIAATSERMPQAPAICAWDGNWTYAELHDMSTRLAHYLVYVGVGPEVIVPLCFEKSKWTPIAILAVMKAGGASVALDCTLPKDRLNSIVQQVKPVLILSSFANRNLATQVSMDKPTVVIDDTLMASLEASPNKPLPIVQPYHTLYIVFTSGSTGTPKGVQISHASFSSALKHQRGAHNFKPGTRVYDFASYAFDVSWSNVLCTLECGACLCIPSDSERSDNLAGSIERFKITHTELTPSVASVLPLSTLQSLDTLILGGERLPAEQAKRLAPIVNLKNSYGPCECTPTSTVADVCTDDFVEGSIGRGVGVNTWVVDTITGESLVPIGSTGELLLEGPLVGPGYLQDPQKTDSAFLENPPWLLRGAPGYSGRKGRLYKTGDLVCYNEDGTLIFKGRKDAQVKIRGQRVELSDIEHHIARHPKTRQSACVLPSTGPYANTLVGVFSIQKPDETGAVLEEHIPILSEASSPASSDSMSTFAADSPQKFTKLVSKPNAELVLEEPTCAIQIHIEALQSLLGSFLPTYMIPTTWVAVEQIPLNPSGKLNRNQLEVWLSEIDQEIYHRFASIDHDNVCHERETEAERVLRNACSLVFDVPPFEIDLLQSFVANGGDSISAMKLIPHCRAANIVFSFATLFTNRSLSEIAELFSAPISMPHN